MEPVRSASSTNDTLDAQAAAFAELLGRPPHELDDAWRKAAALAEGLFPHQVEGVAFLLGRRRAILADDMGLGKTRQAIVALRHASPEGPFLVVCPASVKRNWAREIAAVAEDSATLVLEGSTPLPTPSPCWTVVNYDILSRHIETLAGIPWAGIVFDEAHYLKNHTSARSKLARQLVDRVTPAPAVYLLTGTPLTNRPRDLFVPLQLVGHSLARSFLSFAKRYCDATRNDFGWQTDGASNLEELALQLHGVMLRRSKDTVLSLPPKLRTWLPVGVPEGTGAADIRSVIGLLLGGDTAAVPAEGEEKGGVRTQVVAHLTSARQKLAVAKAGATQDFVAGAVDQGEKVIVFSCFDEPLRKLEEAFGDQAVVLTGRTPVRKRQGLVDRFQTDDQVRVFLANIIAGGVGVNLTAASQVVFNDLDWVPANHWQAEDRAYRIGQTRTVNVTYVFGANTIDEWVQTVLKTKAQLVSVVVEGEAFSGDLPGNVLDELQRALRRLSPGLSDAPHRVEDDDVIDRLLKQAAAELRSEGESRGTSSTRPRSPEGLEALRKALEVLSRALSGPSPTRYRVASSSQPGVTYVITADDTDVECTCPGFEYRGQCRHAREVKAALAAGRQVPAGYRTEDA